MIQVFKEIYKNKQNKTQQKPLEENEWNNPRHESGIRIDKENRNTIEEMDTSVKWNAESKKVHAQNIHKIWDTMKRPI